MRTRIARLPIELLAALVLSACAPSTLKPLPIVASVQLDRFMGDWYVIAATPTLLDRDAHAAMESYVLDADGTIATTYTFRTGGLDGPVRTYSPRAWVLDRESNAVWGMQFLWPFKADYRIAWLTPDYQRTIIARERRDYAWIMARTPVVTEAQYAEMLAVLTQAGYDVTTLRRIPQRAGSQ